MRVLVSGASGLIGSALVPALRQAGHDVTTLVRREPRGSDEVRWDPGAGLLDGQQLLGVEAAVHLSGAGVGDKRWSEDYKREIHDSRVLSTSLLARTLARLPERPRVLLSGSAIGFYDRHAATPQTEADPGGTGFLADVVRHWEAATKAAEDAGIRVVHLRTGLVLDPRGGLLGKQLPIFKLGGGGRLGTGRQWQSWISIDDWVAAALFLLDHDVSGPVNLTAPGPVRQADFARELGRVLHRPAVMRVPAVALKLALGEFSTEVLDGAAVLPTRLQEEGFAFTHPELATALRSLLPG